MALGGVCYALREAYGLPRAISIIFQSVQKHELNIYVIRCNCDVHRRFAVA